MIMIGNVNGDSLVACPDRKVEDATIPRRKLEVWGETELDEELNPC